VKGFLYSDPAPDKRFLGAQATREVAALVDDSLRTAWAASPFNNNSVPG